MRFRYLPGEGVVPVDRWWAGQTAPKRSHLAKPFIRSDGMDATLNHADGQTYESRSAYAAALRATGHHIVERGEQPEEATPIKDEVPGLENDIAEAIQKVEAGYVG